MSRCRRVVGSSAPFLVLALLAACAAPPRNRYGPLHRPITTAVPAAQDAFDEGLLLCYGFNHDEAVRTFERALAADPECAMAWWGIAHALGPNINLPLTDPAVAARAHAAAQKAVTLQGPCTPAERALIAAMAARYADPPPKDRAPLDRAFADAMRTVARAHPQDADAGALFAEAMLDLSPWNQWTKDGKPRPGTEELVATLERVLAFAPDHPLAIHLYIHATEASPWPEKALAAAARLPAAAPGCGHLVHMPAHTLQRCGRYAEAIQANLDAAAVDRAFFRANGPQGIYHLYLAHNLHFATYSAMFAGDSATALRAARELVAELPEPMLANTPEFVDGFVPVPLHVLLRFGRFAEVLAEPEPAANLPVARATWRYARGTALANLGRGAEAEAEQAAFERAAAAVPDGALVNFTPAKDVLAVARHVLAGELLFRSGRTKEGLDALRAGVAAEEALRYDEPSGWMLPVRHALGALLLESGDVAAAEAVYRADLARHRDNGWSLKGLAECQRRRGDASAAEATEAAFARAFAAADVAPAASCYCRR